MNPQIAMMKQHLSPQQLMAFESEAVRYRKEPVVAFLLAFFLGIFGAHHFYLGRTRPGLIMLLCTVSVVGLIVSFPWKIINWFTVWGEAAEANDEIEYALLYSMFYSTSQASGQYPPPAGPPPAGPSTRAPIGGVPMTT